MAANPYSGRPCTSFWSSAVAKSPAPVPAGLYRKKFSIDKMAKIATGGSCFAQHIGRHLKTSGFDVMDMEPPPKGLAVRDRSRFGYGVYSARYGNLYTTRQLLQLAREAFGELVVGDCAWKGPSGGYYDAFRPSVEPLGLGSPAEVRAHRGQHLAQVRQMFESMDLFIFTMGLTEAWEHRTQGVVYPTAPGTIAGEYDERQHVFRNYSHAQVLSDFLQFRELISSRRSIPRPNYLLTVSPVPLTATASEWHVMTATVYSKAVLRAVAGELASTYPDIDYFPSFEIISNPWSQQLQYEENLRSVKSSGVEMVMATFLRAHDTAACVASVAPTQENPEQIRSFEEDVVCEEAMLDAFQGTKS